MKFQKLSSNAGFSFMELMFAFIILTIGITGLFTLLLKSINLNKITPDRIQAAFLADEAITAIFYVYLVL